MSDEELEEKAKKAKSSKKPTKKEIISGQFERNPYVAELAKRYAKGICQLCGSDAPFVNSVGKPYLETHHIVWLSEGGEDSIENTTALCPNCHRKIHVLKQEQDVRKLQSLKIKIS